MYSGRVPSGDDIDFWLGTWEVRWGPTGQETGARSVITRGFGGHVVRSASTVVQASDLVGMSVSVFDPQREL